MTWNDVKKAYPDQWLIIEAIEAHTQVDKRILDNITVVDSFQNNNEALMGYVKLHRKNRERELYAVHTSRVELGIIEQRWIGVRADIWTIKINSYDYIFIDNQAKNLIVPKKIGMKVIFYNHEERNIVNLVITWYC